MPEFQPCRIETNEAHREAFDYPILDDDIGESAVEDSGAFTGTGNAVTVEIDRHAVGRNDKTVYISCADQVVLQGGVVENFFATTQLSLCSRDGKARRQQKQ